MVAAGVAYLDASALVKLLVVEPGSAALRASLPRFVDLVTSRVSAVEVTRAVGRRPDLDDVPVGALVATISFRELDADVARIAGALRPRSLRSLDAIHLASALTLGADIVAFVTYDDRLATAAQAHGLPVELPA